MAPTRVRLPALRSTSIVHHETSATLRCRDQGLEPKGNHLAGESNTVQQRASRQESESSVLSVTYLVRQQQVSKGMCHQGLQSQEQKDKSQ